ncbi:MAG: GNAT family N-acetyltransferase, partial [Streptosporangiaceae bacterium]
MWITIAEATELRPSRTEVPYQGRGIASHILAAGLDRLAAHGCLRFKVASDISLYLRAGFRPWRPRSARFPAAEQPWA